LKTIPVNVEELVLDIYPKIGWYIQSLISSCVIVVLAYEDKDLYLKSIDLVKSKCISTGEDLV